MEQVHEVVEQDMLIIRDRADVAQRQSQAGEDALNASSRPLLVDIRLHAMRTIQAQKRLGEQRPAEIDLWVISGGIAEAARTSRLTGRPEA